MDLHLSEKIVLITGALGGLGQKLVAAFQTEGARVVAADRHSPEEAARAGIPPGVRYVRCDYTRPDTIPSALADARPDIVIANAGVTQPDALSDVSLADWRAVVEVNLTGNFLLGQAAARDLAARGGGVILFIGSWAQTIPQSHVGAYGASKAGMKMMALCLAKEMASRGVRINILSPGIVDGGMAARQMALQPARRERATRTALCGRLGKAEEVADACLFLCSPRASFIHGADLLIDGGASLSGN